MRVLHFLTRSTWGGAQRVVHRLASDRPGSAVACAPGGRLVDRARAAGVPVHEQPHLRNAPGPLADSRALADAVRLFRRERPDVVHCHSTKAGVVGRLAAGIVGLPTVFTVHGWGFSGVDGSPLEPALVGLERHLAPRTDAVVLVSEHDLSEGRRRGILAESDGTVVHNGIRPFAADGGRDTLAEEVGVGSGAVVGSVGRLAEQKDPLAVLRSGRALRDRGLDVETVLVGDGPLRRACERRVRGRPDQHVLGFREDARALLGAFDLLLLPSRFEGLPLVVLEAMHLGVPVVAYDVGGVAEAVSEGRTGAVVPPGDERALVDAAERLLCDPDRRERASEYAVTRARSRFTADRMVGAYDSVYEGLARSSA